MSLGLPDRRKDAAALFAARGLPSRRVEEWKYSDLSRALGEAGFGSATARWAVGPLPAGVELFHLAQTPLPDWVLTHLGASVPNALSAASLAAAGGVALRVRGAVPTPLALEFSGGGQ